MDFITSLVGSLSTLDASKITAVANAISTISSKASSAASDIGEISSAVENLNSKDVTINIEVNLTSGGKKGMDNVSKAIDEMVRQVGKIEFDDNGMMKKGVVVRHLLLPGQIDDSKKIIKYLYDKYHDDIIISIMNQYTPVRELEYDELNCKVMDSEYDELVDYAYDLGVRNAFIQEGDTQEVSFIPDFDKFCAI